MFSFQLLNNPESFSIDQSRISDILFRISREVSLPQNGIINIAFLADSEIQTLNNQYRGIDNTTDVLSFHYYDDFSEIIDDEIVGEIILSESKVLSQAEEHMHTVINETEILIIHGILHILGYDHETDDEYEEMWKFEKIIREKLHLAL
ncbi:rRNA maturation RNase YbeY [Candidatus Gracilibacteria bacterium]|nr:rRNA maturation RNase YbeY [Candidatus Gracilibacteria bacterium]